MTDWTDRIGAPVPPSGETLAEIGGSGLFRGVPRFFEVLKPHPVALRTAWEMVRALSTDGALRAPRKALMGLVIAEALPSKGFLAFQEELLAVLGVPEAVVTSVRRYLGGAEMDVGDRACLELAKESVDYTVEGLVRRTEALRGAGLSDPEIVEAVAAASFYNQLCRMANLLGA